MTQPDPNGARQPGDPFVYKPRPAIDPLEPGLAGKLEVCGKHKMSVRETARMLGVSEDTLRRFWDEHPQFRDAWEAGKDLRRAKLRVLGDRHAALDPATWRFLAKNELDMHDDPSKARVDDETAKGLAAANKGREEVNGRIMELTAKLVGERRLVSGETVNAQARQGVGNGQAQGRQVLLGARQEGMAQPQAHGGCQAEPGREDDPGRARDPGREWSDQAPRAQIEVLTARLNELEASAVRKKPRLDSQPHTDRTKAAPLDIAANKPRPSHIPPRLPGRLGSK